MTTLKEELDKMLTLDTVEALLPPATFQKLPEEDQQALRECFVEWAAIAKYVFPAGMNASLIAVGFVLGHNWVKEHWALW